MKAHSIDIELDLEGAPRRLTVQFSYLRPQPDMQPEINVVGIAGGYHIAIEKRREAVDQWLMRDGYSKCVAIAEGL